ncbi:MAG: CoA-binding protein [Candidatus Binataceae bacterium]|nr:CoA-binding protein [Candidatus Binataceae bacterium]
MTAAIAEQFAPLFAPKSVAVVGASASSVSGGNRFIRHMKAFGYAGEIYPIHPSAAEIEGLKAYRSVQAIPGTVDYAYVAVAAAQVPGVIRSSRGRVRFAQVMSSGFGETAEGRDLERELVQAARDAGVRVIGPNCLGVYSPRGRLTFTERTLPESGSVGVICQSGGLGIDIIRRGQNRGLRYSGLVTVGNCADVQPSELLEYFLQAPDTNVVGLYLEGAGDGRRLFEMLRAARGRKPVVILKGGLTRQGQRAAASHTGALAGSGRGWRALASQTGTVLVESLDAFLDAMLAFQCLPLRPSPTRQAVLFGNGGGTSVLGTDALGRAGFEVSTLDPKTLAALEALGLPAGSSVLNPIDVPAGALQQNEGRVAESIISAVRASEAAEALVMHINMTVVLSFRHVDMLGNLIDAALRVKAGEGKTMHIVLVLRSDGEPDIEERKRAYRQRAVIAGIPVFDELIPAANALAAVRHVEAYRLSRNNA